MLFLRRLQLNSADYVARINAIQKLGMSKNPNVISLLQTALDDSVPAVREAAAGALAGVGAIAIPSLISLVEKQSLGEEEVVDEIKQALTTIGPPAVDPLMTILNDHSKNARIRATAAELLGQILDSRTIDALVAALNDRDARVRSQAGAALAKQGWTPHGDTQRIQFALARHNWNDIALVGLGAEAVSPLILALGDNYNNTGDRARKILVDLGTVAVESLIEALGDSNYEIRWRAIDILGKIGDRKAVEALIKLLNSESLVFGESNGIASSLGEIGDVRAIEPLIAITRIPQRAMRPLEELLKFLQQRPGEIGVDDLKALESLEALIPDIRDVGDNWGINFGTKPVDCTQIRLLSKQELTRRAEATMKRPPLRRKGGKR